MGAGEGDIGMDDTFGLGGEQEARADGVTLATRALGLRIRLARLVLLILIAHHLLRVSPPRGVSRGLRSPLRLTSPGRCRPTKKAGSPQAAQDLWVSGLRKARLSDVESADATLRSAYFAEVAFGYEGCKPMLRSTSQYSVSAFVVRHRRTK